MFMYIERTKVIPLEPDGDVYDIHRIGKVPGGKRLGLRILDFDIARGENQLRIRGKDHVLDWAGAQGFNPGLGVVGWHVEGQGVTEVLYALRGSVDVLRNIWNPQSQRLRTVRRRLSGSISLDDLDHASVALLTNDAWYPNLLVTPQNGKPSIVVAPGVIIRPGVFHSAHSYFKGGHGYDPQYFSVKLKEV